MTITGETKAELRRLQKAARDARAGYDAALAGNAADEVRSAAVREAYEADLEFRKAIDRVGIIPLLDALAAAEAERDRLLSAARELFAHSPSPKRDEWLTAEAFETYKAAFAEMKSILGATPCP